MNSNYQRVDHGTSGVKYAHREIAEAVLGRGLSEQETVHHVDYNKKNNINTNLVICPDDAYHKLVHQRTDAHAATGNPTYRKCQFCKKYDAPGSMYIGGRVAWHRSCFAAYKRNSRIANKVTEKYKSLEPKSEETK